MFIFLLTIFCSSFSFAKPTSASQSTPIPEKNSTTFNEYLTQEKIHLTEAINDTKQQVIPKDEKEYKAKTEKVASVLKMTRIKVESLGPQSPSRA